jgi:hypothetical protein
MGLHEIKNLLHNNRNGHASYTSGKGLITRIYKDLKKLKFPKINDPMKKWANELNRDLARGWGGCKAGGGERGEK